MRMARRVIYAAVINEVAILAEDSFRDTDRGLPHEHVSKKMRAFEEPKEPPIRVGVVCLPRRRILAEFLDAGQELFYEVWRQHARDMDPALTAELLFDFVDLVFRKSHAS